MGKIKKGTFVLVVLPCILFSQEFSRINHAGLFVGIPNSVWRVIGFCDWSSKSILSEKQGWFIDLGISIPGYSTGDDFYDKSAKYSLETLGDTKIGEYNEYLMINGGLTKKIKTSIFYLGGGFTNTKELFQFYDEYEILGGNDGKYWVNGEVDEWNLNFCGGVIINNPEIKTTWMKYLVLGFDLKPSQINIGIGW